MLARAAEHMAARRGLGGTLVRAACCRAHADGLALTLTPPSPSSDAAAPPRSRATQGSGDSRGDNSSHSDAAQPQQVMRGSAAAGGVPRPGAAVRCTPQHSPTASPQKAAAPAGSQGLPAQGLRTPPPAAGAAAVSTPLAQPCSNARHVASGGGAAADGLQLTISSVAVPGNSVLADGDTVGLALAAANAAASMPNPELHQQHAEAGTAAAWAAAAAATHARSSAEHEGPDDLALAIVREHAAALAAAADEQTDSSCSIM